MSLTSWAATAYRHTRVSLIIGEGNSYRKEQTGGLSADYVNRKRSEDGTWEKQVGKWVYVRGKGRFHNSFPSGSHNWCLESAARAMQFRAGNCDEHASVAYKFLWDNRQAGKCVLPGTWVSIVTCDKQKGGDHVFVVLNRDHTPVEAGELLPLELIDGDAIILDVWGKFACDGDDLREARGVRYTWSENPDDGVVSMQRYINQCGVRLRCEFDLTDGEVLVG